MSSVIQTQGVQQVSVTLPDATLTAFNVPRPQTLPLEPAYAEGTDHTTRLPFLREEEGGHCVIDLPAAFNLATVFMRRLSVHRLLPTAQAGVADASSAFFPTGASTNNVFVYDLVNTGTSNTLALNMDAVRDLLGNLRAGAAVRSFPGITLMAGEFVHMELFNASGGALGPLFVNATYKLGLNQADTGKP